jgi:hypothetical protein
MGFSAEKLKQFTAEIPRPLHMNIVEMNRRVDSNSLEFQIAVIRSQIEATAGVLHTYDISSIVLSDNGRSLTYCTPTGHLTWANRHLMHEVVLLVATNREVQGTIIVEGGNSHPVEEKNVIHAYQGPGKPALSLLEVKKEDPMKIKGARITRHTFGKGGIKIDPEKDVYVAFFPAGLGLI